MTDTYTPEEFAASYSVRGYGRKKIALGWAQEHGLEILSEADFQRCYQDTDVTVIRPHRSKYIAMHEDGQNPSAPQNMPNSHGESFARLMAREQLALDRADRAHRERMEYE